MTQEFVSEEIEAKDRLAQQLALADAQEKLTYASIVNDPDLREEGLRDMRYAREMSVRLSEASFARVKAIFLKNDPINSYLAGIATFEECEASIAEDSARLRGYERKMFQENYSLYEIIEMARRSTNSD